jgi:hypothetical protein
MKIKKAIMSSDDNPLYLDFWPIVSKLWKLKFNIEPVLLYFGKSIENIDTTYGTVIQMQTLDNIPVSTQAQCSRLWYAGQCGDEVVVTADIDMLPLSPKYFIDFIKDIDDNKYVNMNSYNNGTYFPMCYNVSKSSKIKEVLDIDEDFSVFMNKLISHSVGKSLSANNSETWFLDESYTNKMVNDYKAKFPEDVIPLSRPNGVNGYRIDRPKWGYDIELVHEDYYYDSHSVRPYNNNKETVDALVKAALWNIK